MTDTKEPRPIIVLDPSWGGTRKQWDAIAADLRQEGYLPIVCDPRAVKTVDMLSAGTLSTIGRAALFALRNADYASHKRFVLAVCDALIPPAEEEAK